MKGLIDGNTLLAGGDNMVSQLTNLQASQQDAESEDSSFTSSSMGNFKSPANASLNEMDEYMYNMLDGGGAHANQYHDEMSYQRLPNLLEQPLLNTKDHYLIKHEEAQPSYTIKNTFCFNPLDPKASLPYSLDFRPSKAKSPLAPSVMRSVEQLYNQTHLHIDLSQAPLKSDYALIQDPPSSPSPFVSLAISDDSYHKHLLDNYGARRQARPSPDVDCLTQPSNEALETTSHAPYNAPYLPSCASFTTSPTLPSIISSNSSPITSLASHASTITDTASVDAASLPPGHCQDHLFVHGCEMMPSLITLHTRSSVTRNSKGKNVQEIDNKVLKKKRKRTRSRKNSAELESQRMTHIAVERNRRRQMNQHLNDLRSLMPSSYIQRGDQASIVGGAIRLVEELEQVLESLHLQKQIRQGQTNPQVPFTCLDDEKNVPINKESCACLESSMVNVQVEMISLTSILVKVMAPKRHHQLLHTLQALSFLSLKVLHLNITTFDISILYSFNLKMEVDCQFQSALELAKSIKHVFETPKIES